MTRLSPECCQIFTRDGALGILYSFIAQCNRSVPHMDLIKDCLKIFTNLAKYSETVVYVLEPDNSLFILVNLLVAYQSSNPSIFMDVCVLFILLAQWSTLSEHLLSQENFIKKLQTIYSTLERRANLKTKSTVSNPQLNSTLNAGSASNVCASSTTSSLSKKTASVSFTISPEWSLSKKQSIELVEPLGALEYLLSVLGVRIEPSPAKQPSAPKTPKRRSLNPAKELSAQKKLEKAMSIECDLGPNLNEVSKSRKTINRFPTTKTPIKAQSKSGSKTSLSKAKNVEPPKAATNVHSADTTDLLTLEEFLCESSNESCLIDTTIKSVASFHVDKPKMNSTSIFTSKNPTFMKSSQVGSNKKAEATAAATSSVLTMPPPLQTQTSKSKPTTPSTRRKLI